jgi:hypothetical protein
MSALMLGAIIVAWLGLWGPINLTRLQQWQTLLAAIIAPSIALYAATLAYQGAMAKVNLDREELDRRRVSEQLGLILRLRAAAERVSEDVSAKIKLLNFQPTADPLITSKTFGPEHLRIVTPDELNEAWTRLDMFPEILIKKIDILRRLLPSLQDEMEKFAEQKWSVQWPSRFSVNLSGVPVYRQPVADDYLVLYLSRCRTIKESCDVLVTELGAAIESLRK